jgi:hypothetical protein
LWRIVAQPSNDSTSERNIPLHEIVRTFRPVRPRVRIPTKIASVPDQLGV